MPETCEVCREGSLPPWSRGPFNRLLFKVVRERRREGTEDGVALNSLVKSQV